MKRFVWNMQTWMMALACMAVVTACGDDEDDPEIVPDPMDTAAYYIAGAVYDYETSAGIGGVTVKAGDVTVQTANDGSYELAVADKKTYTVDFSKTGYLAASATAEVASSAANHSTVFLSATLSVKGVEATVGTAGATVGNKASAADSDVEMVIPAGAIPAGSTAKLSVTPVVEPVAASTTVKTGSVAGTLSLGEMHIESSINSFNEPISLVWQNVATSTVGFSTADVWTSGVLTKAPAGWTKVGTATLSGDNYVFNTKTLNTGYSLEISVNINTSAVQKEANMTNGQAEVTVDNSGKTAAIVDYALNTVAKGGWTYTTSPTQALQAAGASGADLATMADVLTRAVESEEGGAPKTFSVETSTTASISGGYIMHYKNEATYCTRTFTFACVVGGQNKSVVVVVKRYIGSVTTYSNVDATQHSGGKI